MTVYVTGAGGQLGREIVACWSGAVGLSRQDLPLDAHPTRIQEKIRELNPSLLIHCAAHTNVDGAEVQRGPAAMVNGMGTLAIAEGCRQSRPPVPLIYISTDYVEPTPLGYYAWSKLLGEAAARMMGAGWFLIVRTSVVFGQGSNFVTAILSRAQQPGDIPVVSDQIMRPTSAHDLAMGLLRLMQSRRLPGGRYSLPNVSDGILRIQNDGPAVSFAQLAKFIMAESGHDPDRIRPVTTAEYTALMLADRQTRDVQIDGQPVPVAKRPVKSVFDLDPGIKMPPWPDAVRRYLANRPN